MGSPRSPGYDPASADTGPTPPMTSKKIIAIVPNEFIDSYIRELLGPGQFGDNLRTIPASDAILGEIERLRPACVLLHHRLRTPRGEDIYALIRDKSLFSNVPILLYSFDDASIQISEKNTAHIQLPITQDEIMLCLERIMFGRKFVLVVDDSKMIHAQVSKILKDNNYGVFTAYDGREGLDVLARFTPDLITSDIEMPVMNGYEFCRAVKSDPRTESIPLLIMSTLGSGLDIDRGFSAGANDYLTKPIDDEELICRINNLTTAEVKSTREKILVVDDSKMVRNMIVQGLEQQGFKVLSACDGREGYDKAVEIQPDLITSDYDMPAMNGWEMCQKLRRDKKTMEIPVIMLTSRDSKSDRAKSTGTGVKAYLTKPFAMDKLLVVIERTLAESRMRREKEILKFYVSDAAFEAVERAGAGGKNAAAQMRAKEMFATVLFSDIASFTPTCEKLNPRQLIDLLNEYFDLMCGVLKKNNAIIDKFIGDAIMAIFGQVEDGAYRAVKSGHEMVTSLTEFNKDRETPIHMRVGINSGKLYIGDIGSKFHRRDFTVIGDTVNTGQRLESKSRHDGVLISESTYELVKDFVKVEKVGPMALKGKAAEVYAYQVVDVYDRRATIRGS